MPDSATEDGDRRRCRRLSASACRSSDSADRQRRAPPRLPQFRSAASWHLQLDPRGRQRHCGIPVLASQATPKRHGARVTPRNTNNRTVAADNTVHQGRLAKAKQFLQVADDARELSGGEDVADACVTLYLHAGIAAADAICAGALGKHAKGQDHQDAVTLLASVDKQASNSLSALLGVKTRAGYGHDAVSETKPARAERSARSLVEKASP